jgi:hypothetical protein
MSTDRRLRIEKILEEVFAELRALEPSDYVVQRYSSSLQRLLVSVTPIGADGTSIVDARQFLLFEGVSYLQVLPFWKDAPIRLMPFEEQEKFLKEIGLNVSEDRLPCVAYAKADRCSLYIVFFFVDLLKSMPNM